MTQETQPPNTLDTYKSSTTVADNIMKNASISDNANATLALKGLLGIGDLNKTNPSPKKSVPEQSTSAGGVEGSTTKDAQQQPKSSTKKKKKQSKENKSNCNVEKKSSNTRDRNSSKKQKQPKSEQQPQHQQGSNQKGMKKKSPKVGGSGSSGASQTKQKQSQKKQQQHKNENFAWSAFQSPPDPSKLPLPAFGNSFSFDDDKNSNVDKLFDQETNNDTAEDPVVENLNTLSKQAVESQMTSVQKTENEIKAILNIRNDNETSTKEEEKAVEQSQTNDVSYASKVKKHNGGMQSEQHQQESSNSNSHGINLASLTISADPAIINATSPPPKQKNGKNIITNNSANNTPQQLNPNNTNSSHANNTTDPIAMLMNAQSYGTANPTIHSPHQSYNMYNHNQLHSPHHYPVHHAYTTSPQHHQMMPPYYTVQVQVPPVLMPGRRMIVPASPMTGGYPIPVVVPEGVAPGMFIPVSIPNPNTTRGTNAVVHHH